MQPGSSAANIYRIIDGQDAPASARLAFLPCDEHEPALPADTTCVIWTVAGEDAERNTRLWTIAPTGAINMARMLNLERGVITTFDPPLVIFPDALTPQSPFTQTVDMKVTTEKGNPKERGKASLEMTLTARQDITISGQTLAADVVRSVFSADLQNAKVQRITDRWHVPDRGVVMETFEEQVRVFGLVVERTSQTIVLDESAVLTSSAR